MRVTDIFNPAFHVGLGDRCVIPNSKASRSHRSLDSVAYINVNVGDILIKELDQVVVTGHLRRFFTGVADHEWPESTKHFHCSFSNAYFSCM